VKGHTISCASLRRPPRLVDLRGNPVRIRSCPRSGEWERSMPFAGDFLQVNLYLAQELKLLGLGTSETGCNQARRWLDFLTASPCDRSHQNRRHASDAENTVLGAAQLHITDRVSPDSLVHRRVRGFLGFVTVIFGFRVMHLRLGLIYRFIGTGLN
jgi:hypothetical protein